jgi:hypothetical protein
LSQVNFSFSFKITGIPKKNQNLWHACPKEVIVLSNKDPLTGREIPQSI